MSESGETPQIPEQPRTSTEASKDYLTRLRTFRNGTLVAMGAELGRVTPNLLHGKISGAILEGAGAAIMGMLAHRYDKKVKRFAGGDSSKT